MGLSFARELLSLAADLLQVVSSLRSGNQIVEAIGSTQSRILLLVVGIALVGSSLRKTHATSQDDLAEHGFRASVGSTLGSVLDEGLNALDSVSDQSISGRVNSTLWWLVRMQFRQDAEKTSRVFAESRDVPATVYVGEAGDYFKLVLEVALAAKAVFGGRTDLTEELRLWYRRLELVEADMRRQLGDHVVDKARALASRNMSVRDVGP